MQLHYTNCTTLQLQLTTTTPLHHNYNILQLHLQHYNYNYNCTTPHYIQQSWWGDHCNHCNHSRKHNSNHLSVHQWIRPAIRESQQLTLPIGFLCLKLPPPTVLLVSSLITTLIYGFYTVCIYIYTYDICICERTQNHGRRKTSVQTMNFGIKWYEGVKNGWSPSGHRTTVKPCSNLFQAETLDLGSALRGCFPPFDGGCSWPWYANAWRAINKISPRHRGVRLQWKIYRFQGLQGSATQKLDGSLMVYF